MKHCRKPSDQVWRKKFWEAGWTWLRQVQVDWAGRLYQPPAARTHPASRILLISSDLGSTVYRFALLIFTPYLSSKKYRKVIYQKFTLSSLYFSIGSIFWGCFTSNWLSQALQNLNSGAKSLTAGDLPASISKGPPAVSDPILIQSYSEHPSKDCSKTPNTPKYHDISTTLAVVISPWQSNMACWSCWKILAS